RAAEFFERVHKMRFERGHGLPGRAWLSGDVVWVPDLFDETGMLRGVPAIRAGLHGVAAIPLRDSGQTIGVIELFASAARPISERGQHTLMRAAAAVARLIDRRRTEEERRVLPMTIARKGLGWELTFDATQLPVV